MIDSIRHLWIICLIVGGFIYTIYTKEIIGIAAMCLGIWLMQLMHEVK